PRRAALRPANNDAADGEPEEKSAVRLDFGRSPPGPRRSRGSRALHRRQRPGTGAALRAAPQRRRLLRAAVRRWRLSVATLRGTPAAASRFIARAAPAQAGNATDDLDRGHGR